MLGPFVMEHGKLVSYSPASCGKRAVKIASADVGYHESPAGSNMQKFGARVRENGVAWCGISAGCWLQDAGFVISDATIRRHGYVPTLLADAHARTNDVFIVGWNRVRAGDRVCYAFNGPGTEPDHVGVFVKWIDRKNGVFLAIEGNTSKHGSQDSGGGVEFQIRHTSQVAGLARNTRTKTT